MLLNNMISAYEYCYYPNRFDGDDKLDDLSEESHEDLEFIKYLVYDHYTEKDEGYSHYYDMAFDELYKYFDDLLNKYNFKGASIRDAFCEGFDDWNSFENEVNELFNVFLEKNDVKLVKKIN